MKENNYYRYTLTYIAFMVTVIAFLLATGVHL